MPEGAPRVLISGYYGFRNTGDEAILQVILERLREGFPDARVTVLSGEPEETRREHGVEAILWSEPWTLCETVRQADLVIVGGGGLFHDYTGFIPDALLTHGNWGLGYHVSAAVLAALFGKPLMLYAVGVGPLHSEHARQYTRAACDAAHVITVRDTGSKRILESIGVPGERVVVTADPAFALAPSRGGPAQETNGPRPLIGVVARHWNVGVHPAYWERQLAAGLDAVLERTGGRALFVPFQRLSGEPENDAAVARRIHAAMASRTAATVLEGGHSPEDLAAILGGCDLVLGMRLHAIVLSVVQAVPFLALAYDPKVTHALEEIGAPGCSIELGSMTAELLAGRMSAILEQKAGWQRQIADAAPRMRARSLRNAELAAALLRDPSPDRRPLSAELIGLLQLSVAALLRSGAELRGELDRRERASSAEREAFNQRERASSAERDEAAYRLQRLEELARDREEQIRKLTADLEHERARREQAGARWHESLRGYRRERAWSVMLVTRKAYSLLWRQGWRGKWRFLWWLPGLLLGRAGDLEPYELRFPSEEPRQPDER